VWGYRDDSEVDLDHIGELAAAAGLTIEEFLRRAAAAQARRKERLPASTLYQRLQYAGGLRRLVNGLYPRVLDDPLLMGYFKHLDDHGLQWLRWHMLTFLAIATGGPNKYEGRELHKAHEHLHIAGEAFDRLLEHLRATMRECEVARDDQQVVLAKITDLRSAVVTFES